MVLINATSRDFWASPPQRQLVSFIQTTTVNPFPHPPVAVVLHLDLHQPAITFTWDPQYPSNSVSQTPSLLRFLVKTKLPLVLPKGRLDTSRIAPIHI